MEVLFRLVQGHAGANTDKPAEVGRRVSWGGEDLSARMVRLTAIAACHLFVWCSLGSAQEGMTAAQPEKADKPASEPSPPAASQVEESRPVVYYLKDQQGRLVAVPGFSYEEFEQLYKLKEQLAQPDPRARYVLQSISADGTAGARYAELTVQAEVLVREEGWIRVPLGFDRGLLREPAEHEGPGEGFVQFEGDGQGHVGWMRGPAAGQHKFRLKLLVPLAAVGDETRVKLLAPRATVSQLKLRVPLPNAMGKIAAGTGILASSQGDAQATEFTVLGLGSDFELTWQRAGRPPAEQPTVLEVEGTVLARIHAGGVDAEAMLKVRGSGAPFDRLRVRLPPGASLVPGVPAGSSGYSLAPAENGSVPQPGLVEVRFAEKKSGPVEVRLVTRRPRELKQPEEQFELAGFEVAGAARQWGHIDVAADNNWQVRWGDSRGVRQVERLPLEDAVAGFDYYAQPYSLTARLEPKKTRISVEPEYRLLVDAGRVQLEGTLKYTIRGATAFKLDVAWPAGWESVEVAPETLVAVDDIAVTEGGVLLIPLLQPSTGKLELRLSAQWPIPKGSDLLVLPLPQPQADWPAPAAVTVAPADDVELTPNHDSMVGLVRQPVGPPVALPNRRQLPLFYRGEDAAPVFAAGFRVHSQQITVDVTSRVRLDEQVGQVQQKLAYRIDYEPADHLTVRVPRGLAESGQLEFRYGGQPLTPSGTGVTLVAPPRHDGDPPDTSGPVAMQLDLPEACIGTCELEVRYPLRLGELAPGVVQLVHHKPAVLPLPLVMPEEGHLSSNTLLVTTTPELKVRPSGDGPAVWKKVVQESGPPPGLQLSTDQPTPQVQLEVELDEEEGTTVVERAWIQTWLIPSARRDRAVFSFTSDRKELALVVPAGAATDRVQVLLDGKPLAAQADNQGRLVIPLSANPTQGRHLLEVQSDFPPQWRAPGHLSIELPRLAGDVRVDWLYWQLVVPWNEHVIATPQGLTSEFAWQRDGYSWGRKPLLDQSELASWVGLEPGANGPHNQAVPRGVNCYLFSSMGDVERCELRTAGRSWILLIASGAALVAGLLLIYIPLARHPGTLFVATIVLLYVGLLYYPEPALLLAQAASLGLALALVAGLLERSVARRRRRAAALESPSVVLERASTQSHYPLPMAGTQSSTRAAPAVGDRGHGSGARGQEAGVSIRRQMGDPKSSTLNPQPSTLNPPQTPDANA